MAWIRRELDSLGIPPLKRFGQHFLVDKNVRDELVQLANLTSNDTVLEVGPGLGFLTAALVASAGRVIAVEKDRTLAAYLEKKFSHYSNLTVIQGDALKNPIPDESKVVSSPPYNISSKLTLQILNSRFKLAALLMQEEFARRLTAPSGTRDYGRLTVMLQSKAEAKLAKLISRTAFFPKPRVDSALITITPNKGLAIDDRMLFEDLVRALFTQRRRKLSGVLKTYSKARYPNHSETILKLIPDTEKRVFQTSPQEIVTLANQISNVLGKAWSEGQLTDS